MLDYFTTQLVYDTPQDRVLLSSLVKEELLDFVDTISPKNNVMIASMKKERLTLAYRRDTLESMVDQGEGEVMSNELRDLQVEVVEKQQEFPCRN